MALPSTRAITSSAQALDLIPIVNAITSLLQALNPITPNPKNLSSAPLNRFSPFLDPNLVTLVITKQTNPYHALFFFNWASNPNPKNYTHNLRCYEAITNLLFHHSLFHPAIKLLKKSQNLSDFFIGKIIKAYGDKGNIKAAIFWFNQAKSIEKDKYLYSFNSILGVLVKANMIDLLESLFDNVVKEGGFQPDVSSYTILIRGLCKKGMVKSARKVFDEMPCKPNSFTFNTLINGFCKKGDMESASLIFDKMMTEVDCLPEVVTYTTMIDGYCRKGEFVEANKFLNKMVKGGCSPNLLTYNAIIYGLCLRGKVDEAKTMMSEMRLNGVKDNAATHLNILKGLCIAGRSTEAIEYFRWMVNCNMDLDAKAYTVVVNEYCKLRKIDEAVSLLKGMCGRGISPNVSSFNSVFRTLMELSELDRAVLLLQQMPRMGCSPNHVSYSTVICSLCRTGGRMREVGYLIDDMLRNGINIDATMYGCLLAGYSEAGNEMAMQVFNEMIVRSYVIGTESFSVFVEMLCSKGMIVKAENSFEDICRTFPAVERDGYRKILDEHLQTTQGSGKEHRGEET
ncbi:hypothetical protein F3Y22_tig00111013pilonHSYRG00225 [Hibiscus syriacus]|uniref:Pentatricopeptide repeat-containing protein n=1 Tax=Hibiscus syriacus TaxID=106335 RepID=A0A6A2Z6H8_HIBSY|nr:pentatricopeptide repeat-containing protein At1g09900-like [Hibiscus syriacus]KAE8687601.1 hypothetical protein F3Y22_tig00111013pilonHSYRG00225 [Hibiscus syriacus]